MLPILPYLLLVHVATFTDIYRVVCQGTSAETLKNELKNGCKQSEQRTWFSLANSCVKYVPQQLTWDEANKKCVQAATHPYKGRLAFIETEKAYRWHVVNGFAKLGHSWFGLKAKVLKADISKRDQWAFMIGNEIVAPWNQYTVGGLVNCSRSECTELCMKMGNDTARTYYAAPCSEKNHAICEVFVDSDINECKSYPCHNGGTCIDGNNKYTCNCLSGFVGTRCETNKNDCALNPCLNGGTCTDKVNGYTCRCNPGFDGTRCQTNKNECAPNPCANGGKCTDKINGYTCTCKAGYIGKRCLTNKNECASNPCANGGTCTDKISGYTCTCKVGYMGERCQTNKNECASNPCANGGTCTDKINGYTCTCKAGYMGKRCLTNKNECDPNPCSNGGKCTDRINGYTCTCKPGYIGKSCETNKNECNSNPCANGGKCKDRINEYTCACISGFIGPRCQTNKNECDSGPCINGGKCTDEINGYTCTCKEGFTGTRCQTDKDECSSNPCINGGTCTDRVNGYSCQCLPGYAGSTCQTDINECNSNPCFNGGTCIDAINSYSCECLAGFTGPMCKENINECRSEPCQNGGTCDDLINEFNCSCVPGYIGNMCQQDINECASNPCNNGATCINKVNNFTCNCAKLYVGSLCKTDCHWTTWSKAETCHKEGKNCVRQLTRTSKSNVSLCKPSKKDTETTEKCDKMDCHRMSSAERIITAVLQSIGCIWLLALIAVTFVTCLVFKARNLERLLHACEEIVLFIGHLFILFLREATWSHTICMITSIGLQYTMISLFVFFVLEALQQYAYLTNVQVTGNFLSCRTNLVVGFGLPLVITTISAAFWAKDYPAEWSCWLNLGHTLSAGSIVPLLFCSLLTIIILEAATMGHYEALLGVDKTKRLLAKVNHKALLFILPITIAHWITGMYSVYEQYISMYTLVFGLNIALGVLIFIFHGLTHGAVNKYFLKLWRKGRNIVEKVVDETPKANADTSGNAPVVNEVEDLFKWAMNGTLADKKRAKEILFGIKADPLPSHEAISSAPQQPLIVLQPEPKAAPVISEADKAEAGSLFKWAMNGTMADKNQAKQLLFGATISPHFIND